MFGEIKESKKKDQNVLWMIFIDSYDNLIYFYFINSIILVFFCLKEILIFLKKIISHL